MIFSVQELAHAPKHSLWDILKPGAYKVGFDDGEVVVMDNREIETSYYAWSFIQEFDKFTPINSKSHLLGFVNDDIVREKAIKLLANHVFWQAIDHHNLSDDRTSINKLLYQLTNRNDDYFNGVMDNCPEYISSMDVLDLIAVYKHPPICKIRDSITHDTHMDLVVEAQKKVAKIILDGIFNDKGELNSVSIMCRSNMVNMSQMLQNIFMRGYVIDVTATPIPYCVTTPLIAGVRTVEDYAMMSRDLSLSIASNKADLGTATEKLTKLGHVTLSIDEIIDGDCGTTDFAKRILTDETFIHHIGKYYLNKKGELDYVRKEDQKELVGELLDMRSSFYCNEADPHNVCSVCFGKLAESMPPGSGVGKTIQSIIGEPFVQLILKLKHVIASMSVSNLELNNLVKKYFKATSGSKDIHLKTNHAFTSVKIQINMDDVRNLNNIFRVDKVSKLAINKLTTINNFHLRVKLTKKVIEENISLSDKVPFYLSYELLEMIKENVSMLSQSNEYVTIDITGLTIPIFSQVNMIETFKDKGSAFVSLIERSGVAGKKIGIYEIENTLETITTMIYEDLGIPISLIEIMILPFIIQKLEKDINYALTKLHDEGAMHGSVTDVLKNRSLSSRLLKGDGLKLLVDADSYLTTHRVSSTLDTGILPVETIRRYKRKYQEI